MELELQIISYQRLSPSLETRHRFEAQAGVQSLGRSPSCDWHLPDPERVVSSRHATIEPDQEGFFWITDTSTNGLFLNDQPRPLGRGNRHRLAEGDLLLLGDYRLQVSLLDSHGPTPAAEPPVTTDVTATPRNDATLSQPPGTGDRPLTEAGETLASALVTDGIEDTHVDLPEVAIPTDWSWGDSEAEGAGGKAAAESGERVQAEDQRLRALVQGLGLTPDQAERLGPGQMERLGELTRLMLDELLGLVHARALQKQRLRVRQTLFQRAENNPLKFSASAGDALEVLLWSRNPSFMAATDAVRGAFGDIRCHDQALMVGFGAVVRDLLGSPDEGTGAQGLWQARRRYAAWREQREWQREAYADLGRILRSDVFVEAYEAAEAAGPKNSEEYLDE